MQFLYAIINFLILAVLLWLFGRKTVSSIFSTRMERINEELDETERIENTDSTLPALPDFSEQATETISENLQAKLNAIETDYHCQIEHIHQQRDAMVAELQYEAISEQKLKLFEKVKNRVVELLHTEPYAGQFKAKLYDMADEILEEIEITPGDMAYIRESDVLYVTLT